MTVRRSTQEEETGSVRCRPQSGRPLNGDQLFTGSIDALSPGDFQAG